MLGSGQINPTSGEIIMALERTFSIIKTRCTRRNLTRQIKQQKFRRSPACASSHKSVSHAKAHKAGVFYAVPLKASFL